MNQINLAKILNELPLICLLIMWDHEFNSTSFEEIGLKLGWSREWIRKHHIWTIERIRSANETCPI